MNVFTLTLRDLEYLVAISDHAHFGRAALAVHVSQPALSTQIRKVEQVLGIQIFERNNRRVAMTPIGKEIIEQAKVVLDDARKIEAIASQQKAPLSGPLKLGAIASLGPYYLPHLLGPLQKAYPNTKLWLKEGLTDDLVAELKAGTLDAILASPTFAADDLQLYPLFFEPFILAVPKGHPLAHKKNLVASDLKASEMVLLEDGHCLKDQVLTLCTINRQSGNQQFQATSLETLRHLVASGMGYSLLPNLATHDNRQLKSLLIYRNFTDKKMGRKIVLVTRNRYYRQKDIAQLASFLRNHLPSGVFPLKEL